MKRKLFALIVFGIAFGFVEACVVYYIRTIFGLGSNFTPNGNPKEILNLGFIAFLSPQSTILPSFQISRAEFLREIATIIMLGAVAYIASKNLRQKLGAFLISFATWDVFYYIFLRYLTGWPKTLGDIDVFFLVPVAWIGPVITPLIIFIILFVIGVRLYLHKFVKSSH
jgi:hypothetical protein